MFYKLMKQGGGVVFLDFYTVQGFYKIIRKRDCKNASLKLLPKIYIKN